MKYKIIEIIKSYEEYNMWIECNAEPTAIGRVQHTQSMHFGTGDEDGELPTTHCFVNDILYHATSIRKASDKLKFTVWYEIQHTFK